MSNNLYNKHRPNSFKSLEGQKIIKKLLINCLREDNFIQSYLFYGPHGTGKTSLARVFAKAVNCLSFDGKDVCNKCDNCNLINDGGTLDVVEIDAASNNGVEFMRDLVSSIQYLPLNLKKKVYIIDEAHSLSSQSWTSLLKAIEEPPEHVVFLFLTTQIRKVMPTIQSRCQKFQFTFLNDDELSDLIKKVSKEENRSIDDDVIEKLCVISGGSGRELLNALDQLFLNSGKKIGIEDLKKTLSLAGDDSILSLVEHILKKNCHNALELIEHIYQQGLDLSSLFEEIFQIFLELESYKKTGDSSFLKMTKSSELLNIPANYIKYLNVISDHIGKFQERKNLKSLAKVLIFNLIDIDFDGNFVIPKIKIDTSKKISEKNIKEEIKVEIKEEIKPDKDRTEKKKEEESQLKKVEEKKEAKALPKEEIKIQKDESVEQLTIIDTLIPETKEEKKQKSITGKYSNSEETVVVEQEKVNKTFSTKTVSIEPPVLNDFLNKSSNISYQIEIVYCFKFVNQQLSNANFESINNYLSKGNDGTRLFELLNKFNKTYKVIASDVANLIIFDDEKDSEEFNSLANADEVKKHLDLIVEKAYFWYSLPSYLLKKYYLYSKSIAPNTLNKDQIFNTSKKELFDDLAKILN